MRLVLMRHARTSWTGVRYCGTNDPALLPEGADEARAAAALLRALGLREPVVLTSTMRRALETAELVADALGCPILRDERLREVDIGVLEGLTYAEASARWPALAASRSTGISLFNWPGGESAHSLRERVSGFWDARVARATGDLVIVSHGVTLDAIVRHARGASLPLVGPAEFRVLTREDG